MYIYSEAYMLFNTVCMAIVILVVIIAAIYEGIGTFRRWLRSRKEKK